MINNQKYLLAVAEILFVLMLCFNGLYGQNISTFDSLWVEAKRALDQNRITIAIENAQFALKDTSHTIDEEIEVLEWIGERYLANNDIPNALLHFLQARNLIEIHREVGDLVNARLRISGLYQDWGAYDQAIGQYRSLLTMPIVKDSTALDSRCLSGLAFNLRASGDYIESLSLYNSLRNRYQSSGDKIAEANVLTALIDISKSTQDIVSAIGYSEDLLTRHVELGNMDQAVITLNNLGFLHQQAGDLKEALDYFEQSVDMKYHLGQRMDVDPVLLMNIAIVNQNLGDVQSTFTYLNQALDQAQSKGWKGTSAERMIRNLLAVVYLQVDNPDEAWVQNEVAYNDALMNGDLIHQEACLSTRSAIHGRLGNYQKALEAFKEAAEIRDSLRTLGHQENIRAIRLAFSADQLEKELQLLQVSREIESLKLAQNLLENEKLKQDKRLQESQLNQTKLEKKQTEQALLLAEKTLKEQTAKEALIRAREQLLAEQRDNEIDKLEREQATKDLQIAQQKLQAEQQQKNLAQSARERAELNLALQEKDFELKNQGERLFKWLAALLVAVLSTIVFLLYRNARVRKRANEKLGEQKRHLENVLDELRKTQSQLVQSEKMASLGQLTAGVAHEINNPLNFVTTNAHALKLDLKDINQLMDDVHALKINRSEEQINRILNTIDNFDTEFLNREMSELITSIERGVQRTKAIVNGLRTFSRSRGEDFEVANIHEGIDSTLIILNSKLKNRIDVHREYGELPLVPCQFDRLNQVFMNILSNAAQAIEDEGDIHITTEHVDNEVWIRFRDNGAGMTEEVQRRIFEPFFTTKDIGEGTGLGLSISYGIIQDHDGSIKVQSSPGSGTEFLVTLPVSRG